MSLKWCKLVGEQTAEYFSRTRGLEVLSFRIMGTRAPEELPAETAAMGGDPAGEAWLLEERAECTIDRLSGCPLPRPTRKQLAAVSLRMAFRISWYVTRVPGQVVVWSARWIADVAVADFHRV